MAHKGRRFKFHGAFSSKEKAKAKEKEVSGFIKETKVRGQQRFVVMSEK